MTVNGWLQILIFCAIIVALVKTARLVYDARFRRRADIPVAGSPPCRGRALCARRG